MKKKSMGYKDGGKVPTPKPRPTKRQRAKSKRTSPLTGQIDELMNPGGRDSRSNRNNPRNVPALSEVLQGTYRHAKEKVKDMASPMKSGGKMKKKVTGYDKGGKLKANMQSGLKKFLDEGGFDSLKKGGSGAGNADLEKMIKKIASATGKKKGGVIKKKAGGAMKPVPAGKKGLAKLPKPVRNKMGYAKKGGPVKAAKSGGSCRGGGSATRGKGYSKA